MNSQETTVKYQLTVSGSQGYSADQIKSSITVAELREMLEGLEDDAEVVIYDNANGYGASFGRITRYIEEADSEEEE